MGSVVKKLVKKVIPKEVIRAVAPPPPIAAAPPAAPPPAPAAPAGPSAAEIAAQDFVSVQPMNLPSGLVFYLDFKYGSNVLNKSSGDSLAGATGPNSPVGTTVTSFPEGGFYGAGQYGYTAPTASAPFEIAAVDATPSLADINYDTDFSASNAGNFKKYTGKFVNSSSLAMDDLAIRAATLSNIPGNLGNAITSSFPAFTTSGSDGTITFIANISDHVAAHSGATVAETAYLNINNIIYRYYYYQLIMIN